MSQALMFNQNGEPLEVIKKVDTTDKVSINSQLEPNQVLIKFLASPINPADINSIQGSYASKLNFPSIAGNEGVAEVIKVGSGITKLKIGNWVSPALGGFGTWRTHAIASENDLIAIDKDLGLNTAAQLTVNPPTAYRMLKDFVKLKPGDCVLQNGANSAVGQIVIQLCKEWGVKTINVIRARGEPGQMEKLINQMRDLGADHIVTQEDLTSEDYMNIIWADGTPKPILTLNCISGENAAYCIKYMADEGTMVTYGAMSKRPLVIPPGQMIFQQLKFIGFWRTRWFKEHNGTPEQEEMIQSLTKLFKEGKLKAADVIPIKLDNYREALEKVKRPFVDGKLVFIP